MRTDPAFEEWVKKARAVRIENELARRSIKLKRRGKQLAGACPRCGGVDRFYVDPVKQIWGCRQCDPKGGDVIALRNLFDLSFLEICEELNGEPPPQANGHAAPPQTKANGKDAEPKKVVAARFDYTDEAGVLLSQAVRYEFQDAAGNFVVGENGKRKKTFGQRRPDPSEWDGWAYDVKGVRIVPYKLPQLLEAIGNERTVFIVEGERKADLLAQWGLPATCNAGGSKKWSAAHATFLEGADVVVLPDNDGPGREHADVVGASLQGVAARVRILALPGLAAKEDIVDWAAQDHTREELDGLVEAAAEWQPNGPKNDAPASEDYGGAPASGEEAPRKPKLTILSSAEFIKGFVSPDELLEGVLQRRFCYSFTGRTGGGKTAVLLLLAASTALARAIGPHAVEKGRVLYFAGENPDDVRMRWIALSQQMDFDVDTIDVHFIAGVFKISELMDEIKTQAAALGGVSLVIIDTSAAYFEGDDENANKPAGEHARRFRELTTLAGGPCVVVACHPPKNAGDDNLQPRGGGAFIAEIDGNLTARRDDSAVEVHWQGKYRGPDFAPIMFLLRTVTHEQLRNRKGKLLPTVVAAHLSEIAQQEIATVARSRENELLRTLNEHGAASHAELATLLGWKMRDGQPYKVLVRRTLSALAGAKLISKERDGYALTPKGLKAIGTKGGQVVVPAEHNPSPGT